MTCGHEGFETDVEINRLCPDEGEPVHGFIAEIKIRCSDCGEPFRWTGLQAGMSMSNPMCSVDESILRAPIRPASAHPDFGKHIPGFSVSVYTGEGGHESDVHN